MQVSTLSAQLGLGSELLDWYGHATSVPYSHLFIDLSRRASLRLRYSTDNGSVPSIFYISDRLKHLECSDEEHSKSFYTPSDPMFFRQIQKSIPSVLSERIHPLSLRLHSNLVKENPRNVERHHAQNFKDKFGCSLCKENNLEAKKGHSGLRERFATNKSHYSSRL